MEILFKSLYTKDSLNEYKDFLGAVIQQVLIEYLYF